eukprot:5052805-Pleurochrysis_carterae.AAC.3
MFLRIQLIQVLYLWLSPHSIPRNTSTRLALSRNASHSRQLSRLKRLRIGSAAYPFVKATYVVAAVAPAAARLHANSLLFAAQFSGPVGNELSPLAVRRWEARRRPLELEQERRVLDLYEGVDILQPGLHAFEKKTKECD